MSRFKEGDMVIVQASFGDAIDRYYWPPKGKQMIGTRVRLGTFTEAEEPSWYIQDTFWYIPERCLAPLIVEEYV